MKYLKTFEDTNNNFKIGDYVIFTMNLTSFDRIVITKDKPYKIIDVYDDGFNDVIVIYDDYNEKSTFNEFDTRMKKISKKEAEFILDQNKYNL